MMRSAALCVFLMVVSPAAAQQTGAPTIAAAPVPRQAPQPFQDRQLQTTSSDAASTAKRSADQALLMEKIAQRDRLQREIDELRRATGTPQQILVRFKVIEVSRTKLRRLGVDFAAANGIHKTDVSCISDLISSKPGQGNSTQMEVIGERDPFHGLIRALEKNHVAKVLAEPSVVTVSGRPASFHVGGVMPRPAKASPNSEIEFTNFGTEIDVLPVALGDNKVRLELRMKVSEPDYTREIQFGAMRIPPLNVRQCDTAIEIPLGHSGVLTGLVERRAETLTIKDNQQQLESEEIELLFIATPAAVEQ